ncbi:MAG: hypothetical protein KFF72_03525 [Arthrospira sp. SH-MAG29]|nr:hypothetical protein [Arthrospira sp. SH-MAG29]MBS0015430.1 hypothetical protein [Arthrospira sp. SH-MAG29]
MPIRFEMRPTGGGGNGGAYYRFSKSGMVELVAGDELQIVPSTSSPVKREILIKGESPFSIRWDGSNNVLPVFEDAIYFDSSDGGISIFAISNTTQTVEIWVRQETEIDYELGQEIGEIDDMPMPDLLVRPFGATANQQIWAAPAITNSADWEDNAKYNTFARAASVLYQFDIFYPGQIYNFTINSPDSWYLGTGEAIKVFLCPREIMAMTFSHIAVYQWEFFGGNNVHHLIDWVKSHSEVAAVHSMGGSFSIIPTMSRQLLFFDTLPDDETDRYLCNCTYTPNLANPKEGGEFTIVGIDLPSDW